MTFPIATLYVEELKATIVYTGATRDIGSDLDTFEERLIELLTQRG